MHANIFIDSKYISKHQKHTYIYIYTFISIFIYDHNRAVNFQVSFTEMLLNLTETWMLKQNSEYVRFYRIYSNKIWVMDWKAKKAYFRSIQMLF